jgi:hypothetical protein
MPSPSRTLAFLALLALAPALHAATWGLEANVGELRPLGQNDAPMVLVNEAGIFHQKTGGPIWSLDYQDYGSWLLGDFYLLRLERSNWFRADAPPPVNPKLPIPKNQKNWNLGWSLGWELGVGPGQVSGGPELGLVGEAKVWRKLWLEAKAEQTFYKDSVNSDASAGLSLRNLFVKGLQFRASLPILTVYQYQSQPTWFSQAGLAKAGLSYQWESAK